MTIDSAYSPNKERGGPSSKWPWIIGGLVTVILLISFGIAAYGYFSPYLTLWQIKKAVDSSDGITFVSYVDVPAFKESLKAELNAKMVAEMAKDQTMKDNPFAGLGAALADGIVSMLVESIVTPQGIERLISGDFAPAGGSSKQQTKTDGTVFNNPGSWYYQSINVFHLPVTNPEGETFTLIFVRHWLGDWKLTGIKLPMLGMGKLKSESHSKTDSTTNAPASMTPEVRKLLDTSASSWIRYFRYEDGRELVYKNYDFSYRGDVAIYWLGLRDTRRGGAWEAFMQMELNCWNGRSRITKAYLPDGSERAGVGWSEPGEEERALLGHVCSQQDYESQTQTPTYEDLPEKEVTVPEGREQSMPPNCVLQPSGVYLCPELNNSNKVEKPSAPNEMPQDSNRGTPGVTNSGQNANNVQNASNSQKRPSP
jgi:hypothetical protein